MASPAVRQRGHSHLPVREAYQNKASSTASSSTARLVALLWLCLISSRSIDAASEVNPGGYTLFQLEHDPLAQKDSFQALPEREKQYWARQGLGNEDAVARGLLEQLEVTTAVEIKLVGFDGDGAEGVRVREEDFARYLDALRPHPYVDVLHSAPHSLLARNKVLFHVTKAPRQLATQLWKAINDALLSPQNEMGADRVPALVVDRILLEDQHAQDKLTPTIYLLNLRPQSDPYLYWYLGQASSQMGAKCPGPIHTTKERVLWIDLAAGPATYGPLTAGEGLVLNTTIPNPKNYPKPQHSKAFVADLVSLAASAIEHLLLPPLDRAPIVFVEDLEIRLIHITEAAKGDPDYEELSSTDLAWTAIERVVKEELVFHPQQAVRMSRRSVALSACEYCAAAYTRALKTATEDTAWAVNTIVRTNHFAFREGLETIHWNYIDSEELHHWLRSFYTQIMSEIGEPLGASHSTEAGRRSRVIPVYLFDLETATTMLLDKRHQAVAFDEMVIAVRNKAPVMPVDFSCQGQVATIKPKEVTRSIMAALLQTVFGVSPTHKKWSPLHNKIVVNWLWSVGQTPFGPLADSAEVSFAQKDAAARNVVLSQLNVTVTVALHLLDAAKAYGGAHAFLGSSQQGEYAARLAVLKHKLGRSTSALSLVNYKAALYFALSALHEVHAMSTLLDEATQQLTATLDCYTDPPIPYLWYAMVVTLTLLGVYGWRQRDRFLKGKRKRF